MAKFLSIQELEKHPNLERAVERLEPAEKGFAAVAKGRWGGPIDVAYEVHGTGPIHIVWIMGLNAAKIAWWRQMRYFGREHGDKFTNVVFDNRGIGDTSIPLARYTTSEMAKDVIDLVDHLGWTKERQLHVSGVSMGGMIAQELAYLIPHRIASLCLQSTAAQITITLPIHQHLINRITMVLPKTLEKRLQNSKGYLFSKEWLEKPDDEGLFPTNGDRYVGEELWKIKEVKPPVFRGFLLQGLAASWHSMSEARLAKVGASIPDILVCTGDADKMIEDSHSDTIVKGLNKGRGDDSKLEKTVFPGVGHALGWEAEKKFNPMIEEFVTKAWEKYRV